MYESLEKFEIRRDSTTDCGVSCPLATEKITIDLLWENGVVTFSQLFFDRILFILAGNNDIHKSLDEFEIRPDPTPDHRVTCL